MKNLNFPKLYLRFFEFREEGVRGYLGNEFGRQFHLSLT